MADLAILWQFIQLLKEAFSGEVAFADGSSGLSSHPLLIPYTCFCLRSRLISVAHCAVFRAIESGDSERNRTHIVSQLSVIAVCHTARVIFSGRSQKNSMVCSNWLACGDASPWRSPPFDKRQLKCSLWGMVLNARAHNLLPGGVCLSRRVCAGVYKGQHIVSCNKTYRIDIWSINA